MGAIFAQTTTTQMELTQEVLCLLENKNPL